VSYEVIWRKKAAKHFRQLDKDGKERVTATVNRLTANPRPLGAEHVVSMPGVLRVRNGDYRVLYSVVDDDSKVWVEDVRHRSKIYGGH
jgi:mRNA interferase RelE/StbE